MAGIIEAQERAPCAGCKCIERFGLGGAHVRPEAAEPNQRRTKAFPAQDGERAFAMAAGKLDVFNIHHGIEKTGFRRSIGCFAGVPTGF